MSFSLLFFTGRINLLYARTLINSSYKRFASGLARVTIFCEWKEKIFDDDNEYLNAYQQSNTNQSRILRIGWAFSPCIKPNLFVFLLIWSKYEWRRKSTVNSSSRSNKQQHTHTRLYYALFSSSSSPFDRRRVNRQWWELSSTAGICMLQCE